MARDYVVLAEINPRMPACDLLVKISARVDFEPDLNLLSQREVLKKKLQNGKPLRPLDICDHASPELFDALLTAIENAEKEFSKSPAIMKSPTKRSGPPHLGKVASDAYATSLVIYPEFTHLRGRGWHTILLYVLNKTGYSPKYELFANQQRLKIDGTGDFVYPGDVNLVTHHLSEELMRDFTAHVNRWIEEDREAHDLKKKIKAVIAEDVGRRLSALVGSSGEAAEPDEFRGSW